MRDTSAIGREIRVELRRPLRQHGRTGSGHRIGIARVVRLELVVVKASGGIGQPIKFVRPVLLNRWPANTPGPRKAIGPISRKPLESGVETPNSYVCARADGAELFTVLEYAAAHRLFFDLDSTTIFVGKLDKVVVGQHRTNIGIITAHVNGFLTDGKF
jgi:hypothetical protein